LISGFNLITKKNFSENLFQDCFTLISKLVYGIYINGEYDKINSCSKSKDILNSDNTLLSLKLLSYWANNIISLSNKHNIVNNYVLELNFGLMKCDLTFNMKKPISSNIGSLSYIIPSIVYLNMEKLK